MLDKADRGEEGRVKRRTNEKHPCGKALSHLPQLTTSTASLLSSALCPHTNSSPLWSRNGERRFGSILSKGGFFIEESMATTTRKKSTRMEELFVSAHTAGLVPFLLFRKVESRPWVTAFAIFPPNHLVMPSILSLTT